MAKIRMLQSWNGYGEDSLQDFGATENARLVSIGYATNDLDGPDGEDDLTAELAAIGMSQSDAQLIANCGAYPVPAAPQAVIAGSFYSTRGRGQPFAGWGQAYSVPNAAFEFTHLYINKMMQDTFAAAADQWSKLVFTVRATNRAGAIVATGEYKIPVYKSTIDAVLVELDATVTAALVGGVSYWVDYMAYNSAGGRCPVGESSVSALSGALSNSLQGTTEYIVNAGTWSAPAPNAVFYALVIEPWKSQSVTYRPQELGVFQPTLVLPPLYAVVGRECNVYFTGLGEYSPRNITFDVVSTKGKQQRERWTYIPDTAGTYNITINATNPWTNDVLASAVSTVKVCDANAAGTAVVLSIGDSVTAAGIISGELLTLDAADANLSLSLIGTQGTGPNFHEGRGGWKATSFITSGSPFWIGGKVDIAAYLANNALATPTHVIIHLGINDTFSEWTDADADIAVQSAVDAISILVNDTRLAAPNAKIGIALTTPPAAQQDAVAVLHDSEETVSQYAENWKRLIVKLNQYFSGYNNSTYKIYLLPYSVALDTVNNMPTETVAVNSRNASTVVRQTSVVHPADSGYKQLADVAYAWIKNTL